MMKGKKLLSDDILRTLRTLTSIYHTEGKKGDI